MYLFTNFCSQYDSQYLFQLKQYFCQNMFVRLKEKPYYFTTDRQTKYTFLVDNRGATQSKHLYYPENFQTMTTSEIRGYKWSLVRKLMWWSLFNSDKMTRTDRNLGLTIVTSLFFASFFRKMLFRIEFPFFEMAFQDSIFSSRWIKSLIAYSTVGYISYHSVNKILKEEYLVDLALEYRYCFDKSLTCRQCDNLLDILYQERFKEKSESVN